MNIESFSMLTQKFLPLCIATEQFYGEFMLPATQKMHPDLLAACKIFARS
jgi:hypothetical protein